VSKTIQLGVKMTILIIKSTLSCWQC